MYIFVHNDVRNYYIIKYHMAGGLLQLAVDSNSIENVYLTFDPQITPFKTIYRRHTNFSKEEKNLSFNTPLTYNKEGICTIHKFGDLLHRLFLVIRLPKVNIVYTNFTIREVKDILKKGGIIWITTRFDGDEFNKDAYDELVAFITKIKNETTTLLSYYQQMLAQLQPNNIFDPNIWIANNPNGTADDYYQAVINSFILFDKYYIEYLFVDAQEKDRKLQGPYHLTNSIDIQQILFQNYLLYAISYPTAYNDENIRFLYNTETANYIVSGKINQLDSSTVFRTAIANVYGNQNYFILDSYKIFNQIVTDTQTDITSIADVQNITRILTDNIRYSLQLNLYLLKGIYNSLDQNTKFTFYRVYTATANNLFSTANSFNNYSLQSQSSPVLNDNFTSKFVVLPLPNQPTDVDQPFSNLVDNLVTAYHTLNQNIYRSQTFSDYFNDYSLWPSIDFTTSGYAPAQLTVPPKTYFLNYTWLQMIDNIPNALSEWLQIKLPTPTRIEFINVLKAAGINMKAIIQPMLNTTDTINTLTTMSSIAKVNNTTNGDIMITGLFRPYYLINGISVPDYIVNIYNTITDMFVPSADVVTYNSLKNDIHVIIGLFVTVAIPTYNDYITQNMNISSNPYYYINNINNTTIVYNDILSSIYYNIYNSLITNYNSLYNTSLLGFDYYGQNVGIELQTCIQNIASAYLTNFSLPYNYYFNGPSNWIKLPNSTTGVGIIGDVINNKIVNLNNVISKYDENRGLLNMKNIIVPKAAYYYQQANIVIQYISNIIENNESVYYHQDHPIPSEDIVLITENKYMSVLKNALDIALLLKQTNVLFDQGITNGPNKKQLYNSYGAFINPTYYDTLYGWLLEVDGAQQLYSYLSLLETNYNGLMSETDFYNFLKYYTLLKTILYGFVNLERPTIVETNQTMITYLETQINELSKLLDFINGNGIRDGILKILENSLRAGTPAKFAWIQKIGHYIINFVKIQIGDQVIDTHSGQWMDLYHELIKNDKKEMGYRMLIGDVDELTVYDNVVKQEYELIIPINFWFCKFMGVALPLVALLNSDVTVTVNLKDFDDLCYYEPHTKFIRNTSLKCGMIGEYVYVDSDERNNFAKSKLEYLIDQVQYNGDILLNYDSLVDNSYTAKMYFKNSCKEYVWCLQNVADVKNKLWYKYSTDVNGVEINPIVSTKVMFNSRTREHTKGGHYFNFVVPYERHHHTPRIGINNYVFSLYPEEAQPSCAANLSRIDDSGLVIEIFDDLFVQSGFIEYVLHIYCQSYNILRVCSGMAGLLMFE